MDVRGGKVKEVRRAIGEANDCGVVEVKGKGLE